MTHSLVINFLIIAISQAPTSQARPIVDPDAYAIYTTLLPTIWRDTGSPILLVQETERMVGCRIPAMPEGWEGVREDFDRQNLNLWLLNATLPTDAAYRLIPRAEIDADDARLERQYPGIWQRRPRSMEFAAVSAVGFNAAKTKAVVYVRLRSSGQTYMMERHGQQWVRSSQGQACGWIA